LRDNDKVRNIAFATLALCFFSENMYEMVDVETNKISYKFELLANANEEDESGVVRYDDYVVRIPTAEDIAEIFQVLFHLYIVPIMTIVLSKGLIPTKQLVDWASLIFAGNVVKFLTDKKHEHDILLFFAIVYCAIIIIPYLIRVSTTGNYPRTWFGMGIRCYSSVFLIRHHFLVRLVSLISNIFKNISSCMCTKKTSKGGSCCSPTVALTALHVVMCAFLFCCANVETIFKTIFDAINQSYDWFASFCSNIHALFLPFLALKHTVTVIAVAFHILTYFLFND
jgi:hypothetical protein